MFRKLCPTQFPRAQSDVFKCLDLSDHQSTLERDPVYSDMKQANPHTGEAGTR